MAKWLLKWYSAAHTHTNLFPIDILVLFLLMCTIVFGHSMDWGKVENRTMGFPVSRVFFSLSSPTLQ